MGSVSDHAPETGAPDENELDYEALTVVAALPRDCFLPQGGEEELARLRGAQIIRIGGVADACRLEGGGLVIDYVPEHNERAERLVLAFNELGMWVEYQSKGDATRV